jgi:hypothetical protein
MIEKIEKKKKARALMERSATAYNASRNSTERTLPAYYIILQFASKQHYNLSIQGGPYDKYLNVSLPACSLYDGKKYVPCADCNIASYTQHNATFACYDIQNLCPSGKPTRRLSDTFSEDYGQSHEDRDRDIEEEWASRRMADTIPTSLSTSYPTSQPSSQPSSSPSAVATKSIAGDDNGPGSNDDQYSTKNTASASQFGSVLEAIGAELANVLSLNPFTIDLSKATAILAFVGTLAGIIIFGSLFFLRKDKDERHVKVYLKEVREKEFRKKIAMDLRMGGNGLLHEEDEKSKSIFMEKMNASFRVIRSGKMFESEDFIPSALERSTPEKVPLIEKNTFDILGDENKALHTSVLISGFADKIIPKYYSMDRKGLHLNRGRYSVKGSALESFETMLKMHYMTGFFFKSNRGISRTINWLECTRMISLGIFIDTLIYGVYFPSDATCTILTTKGLCLSIPSKVVQGDPLCLWDKDSGCSIAPPPATITFVLLIAFIIMIFILPLDFGMKYLQDEFASKRPDLDQWGMTTDSWLGAVYHERENKESHLPIALSKVAHNGHPNGFRRRTSRRGGLPEGREESVDSLETGEKEHEAENDSIDDHHHQTENDAIAKKVYLGFSTPHMELLQLMTSVKVHHITITKPNTDPSTIS